MYLLFLQILIVLVLLILARSWYVLSLPLAFHTLDLFSFIMQVLVILGGDAHTALGAHARNFWL